MLTMLPGIKMNDHAVVMLGLIRDMFQRSNMKWNKNIFKTGKGQISRRQKNLAVQMVISSRQGMKDTRKNKVLNRKILIYEVLKKSRTLVYQFPRNKITLMGMV